MGQGAAGGGDGQRTQAVANFVAWPRHRDYSTQNASGGATGRSDGAVFHRVIDGFMIQAATDRHRPRRPGLQFADEFHGTAVRQAVPACDGQRAATSQFFITVGGPAPEPPAPSAVVDPESQKVVDAIATTAVDRNDNPNDFDVDIR
ncbi:MAG: peptidylprolyl isomerase [Mycolicibacterium sp.]|nr:peptidylprolyl isomerase [Mycolicibacterium sp.]